MSYTKEGGGRGHLPVGHVMNEFTLRLLHLRYTDLTFPMNTHTSTIILIPIHDWKPLWHPPPPSLTVRAVKKLTQTRALSPHSPPTAPLNWGERWLKGEKRSNCSNLPKDSSFISCSTFSFHAVTAEAQEKMPKNNPNDSVSVVKIF